MSLLHVSISADAPEEVAGFIAQVMGGEAMPFPPFPDCWIAFCKSDDGTAIEVYPTTHRLTPGLNQVSCEIGPRHATPTFTHVALSACLNRVEIIALAKDRGWLARICDRGPFTCVEVWLENRLLVEILDADMRRDYHKGMTSKNWASMFGLAP